jgi:hypothetical protein
MTVLAVRHPGTPWYAKLVVRFVPAPVLADCRARAVR